MSSTAAQMAAQHVRHLRTGDPVEDGLLDGLLIGLTNGQERLTQVAFGLADGTPGERVLTDPRVCPMWALPHAAVWVGGTMPPARPAGLTELEWETYARQYVIEYGAYRGSPRALRFAAQQFLTPGSEMRLIFGLNNQPFDTLAITRTAETTDPEGLVAALNADDVVLAGARVFLTVTDAVTWTELSDADVSWQDLISAEASWSDLAAHSYNP